MQTGTSPGYVTSFNPIADAGPAGGGASVNEHTGTHEDMGYLPAKRHPSASLFSSEGLEVPENLGQIPGSETAVNGAFKNQPPANPQKSVFLTYNKDNNRYYDCKLPLKINIPGGDFGLYKIQVNEVLFRNDAPIFDDSDWFEVSFKNINFRARLTHIESGETAYGNNILNASENITCRFTVPVKFRHLNFNYLTMSYFEKVLIRMILDFQSSKTWDFSLTRTNIPKITIDGATCVYSGDAINEQIKIQNLLEVQPNFASGEGLAFLTATGDAGRKVNIDHKQFDLRAVPAENMSFSMTCSDHLRNILVPFATVREIASGPVAALDKSKETVSVGTGIDIPYLNFAGPLGFMLNSSAQTTCPISNENAAQFKTCALSYNTNIVPHQLVQMTSNIPLILREGTDFRVWLTDFYGNPVRLQSPMYIQVTVSPFSNQALSQVISQM